MLVNRLKTKFNTNEPIFTNEILETFEEYSRAYVFRLIDKAEKNGEVYVSKRANLKNASASPPELKYPQ